VQRLLQDDFPILCEGLHTTTILSDPRLRHRKIFVRTANPDTDTMQQLIRDAHAHLLCTVQPTGLKLKNR
jgi:hypothetical protein